ncbi:MAG TPA: GNAT family N-acetyltransferase [Solirubrobacteraceae bacterium]|jgi:predicted acetyltransferase|nr:GNAT family N-acetyltransferase [Solirubrobacteraceae bacterium]
MPLRLRPLRSEDEPEALAAHEELAREDFTFLLGWEPEMSWPSYVRKCERHRAGLDLTPPLVPATFLAAETGGALVGRISIRHELSEYLAEVGGHVGYAVRPAYRRRGYATEILRQGVIVARSIGIADVLVTCDEGNDASIAVIERAGGVLEDIRPDPDGPPKRRYWIS